MARGLICCVLKSGGDFTPAHVEWLRKQCVEHMPDWEFCCWSDMDVPDCIPLRHNWSKWWAKMQIYEDTLACIYPTLVIDLDTVFVGHLDILPEHEGNAIFIRDPWKDGFRHPERLAGGFMYLPTWARWRIWQAWDPNRTPGEFGGDDQPFLHKLFAKDGLRFQDHYIDQIVSYKVHVKALGVQPDNRVIYFHGTPRPWDASDDWIPKGDFDGSNILSAGRQASHSSG